MQKTKRPTGAFVIVVIFAFALYFLMDFLQKNVLGVSFIPDYTQMETSAANNGVGGWLMWILGDMTEANFYKSYLASAFLIAGALIAHVLAKRNSKYQGIPVAYGTGLMPWILTASTISLLLSNLFYGWNIAETGWFPTFTVFVSCAAATVVTYGKQWRVIITGAVIGAILVPPISRFIMIYVAGPAGLPGVIGSVAGMWIGCAIAFEIYKILPWMELPALPEPKEKSDDTLPEPEYKHRHPGGFFVRRLLADFSEPIFAGNEIAGGCMLIGLIISWILSPTLPVYGSGTLPALLLAEILTGAISIFLYWREWMENAWFPTFPSMVSVAPALVWFYEGSFSVAIVAAVLGGVICPGIANFTLRRLPETWPSAVATTFSMSVGTLAVGMAIICAKGILPI